MARHKARGKATEVTKGVTRKNLGGDSKLGGAIGRKTGEKPNEANACFQKVMYHL